MLLKRLARVRGRSMVANASAGASTTFRWQSNQNAGPTQPPPQASQAVEAPSSDPASSVAASASSKAVAKNYKVGDTDPELRAPTRVTGLFSVNDTIDKANATVGFGQIDDLETDAIENMKRPKNAVLLLAEEDHWKNKLRFEHKVMKTPKHLTWAEFGREVECLECAIDLDEHRPEEVFKLSFFFRDKRTGVRDLVWEQRNDVGHSSGLQDIMGAIGSCLGRADVHRTVRFDDAVGTYREINLRKNSAYTSEIVIAFRPPVSYDLYKRAEDELDWEKQLEETGIGGWGYHPSMQDPDNRDLDDPVGTYKLTISAHAFSIVFLKAVDRLVCRPLKDFYRPSQVARSMTVTNSEHLGLYDAVAGWLGADERKLPHYTPFEAIEAHWFGADSPFKFVVLINKLREMTYLKKENPELRSWLSVRQHEAARTMRNLKLKLSGAGASPLFAPLSHNATVGHILPKSQRRSIKASVSIAGVIGMPDETRKISELKKIAESGKMLGEASSSPRPPVAAPEATAEKADPSAAAAANTSESTAATSEKPKPPSI